MHFGVTGEHKYYYSDHGWIEFEGAFALSDPAKLPRSRNLAEVMAELSHERSIRLVCCQPLPKLDGLSLSEICSVRGIVGGAILCLKGESENELLPSAPGSAIFVKPSTPLSVADAEGEYLLVIYGGPRLVYADCALDPVRKRWKEASLSAGDRIDDIVCPVLFRS
jgi:hypothetical protein